jgi:ABC-type transporter Mla MlaB component
LPPSVNGKDTGIIDLILVGDIDQENLIGLVRKTERYIDRKIKTLVLTSEEWMKMISDLKKRSLLKLWQSKI